MQSTMQDFPLTIGMIFRHGRRVYADSEVVTFEAATSRRASYAQVAERAEKLAAALKRLGVEQGDRVGTFCWNTQEHLEAYLAVPGMGAVMTVVVVLATGLVEQPRPERLVRAVLAPRLGDHFKFHVRGRGWKSALFALHLPLGIRKVCANRLHFFQRQRQQFFIR